MKWYKTRSPFIIEVGYDTERHVLIVQYGSGNYQAFSRVPETEVANLLSAPSLKAYWEAHFKDRYPQEPTDPD